MSNTDHRVSNLESKADGYFRVRAYVGTATDRVFGEWSEADKASTDEPPPPPPAERAGRPGQRGDLGPAGQLDHGRLGRSG